MELINGKPPEGELLINIEGEKGASLFHHPIKWFVEKDMLLISEQFERYKKLVEAATDERLLAIIGALSTEEALDLFLGSYIPGYKRVSEIKDFTLSMKIEIALSLRLIPSHILNTVDLVRAIRNEFAHNLSIDCFDSLDEEKFKKKLEARFQVLFPNDKHNNREVKHTFTSVVEGVIVALGVYASHVKSAKEYIYSNNFSGELIKRIKEGK
jgi:hypothetical protein